MPPMGESCPVGPFCVAADVAVCLPMESLFQQSGSCFWLVNDKRSSLSKDPKP